MIFVSHQRTGVDDERRILPHAQLGAGKRLYIYPLKIHRAMDHANFLFGHVGVAQDLGDAVTLLGHRDDAPRLIRAADLYVSSSWSEGLGTSILEALASKTPVVATRAGGADEMVLPNETGHLVESRNSTMLAIAMTRSLMNPDDAQRMAEAGLKLILQEFTAERMVEGNLRVYEELLKDE